MNERIRELVGQAGLDNPDFPVEDWDDVPLTKFAELIIEECMAVNRQRLFSNTLGDQLGNAHNNAIWRCCRAIQEHCGV